MMAATMEDMQEMSMTPASKVWELNYRELESMIHIVLSCGKNPTICDSWFQLLSSGRAFTLDEPAEGKKVSKGQEDLSFPLLWCRSTEHIFSGREAPHKDEQEEHEVQKGQEVQETFQEGQEAK